MGLIYGPGFCNVMNNKQIIATKDKIRSLLSKADKKDLEEITNFLTKPIERSIEFTLTVPQGEFTLQRNPSDNVITIEVQN